ncbi:MAG: formylglycine-generating enzyme family protein [Bacteroidetes bacterium]|nr:formylglycine-generating enzyme family protein [Bacteroidota bacterium]MBU1720640.1 formylglycine-generating enzyme family protein [Bacteroidota bacterium]
MQNLLIISLFALTAEIQSCGSSGNGNTLNTNGLDSSQKEYPVEKSDLKKMIFIQGGTFMMGDSTGRADEKPVHRVSVAPFYIDETPVTCQDFIKYVEDGGSPGRYWSYESYNIPGNPVTGINWYHAIDFCNWRSRRYGMKPCYVITEKRDKYGHKIWETDSTANGFRLPTEEDFEFAARGGLEQQKYIWGSDFDSSWANYDTERGVNEGKWWRLALVKEQKPNGYGLYGMCGNIWHWCNNWYSSERYIQKTANVGNDEVRALRGGGWGSTSPFFLRVACRSHSTPGNYNYDIGFRCVRNASSAPTDSVYEVTDYEFYQYPDTIQNGISIEDIDFYSELFIQKLSTYIQLNYPNCLYFIEKIDQQEILNADQIARLVVEESKAAEINPLFLAGIMISESGFATVSFPRWYNNPMAYHWQNKNMEKGLPTYDADKQHNRKYKDLRAAIQNYSKIKRQLYYDAAAKDLYSFHKLYVGYEAKEWMYTICRVYREVAGIQLSPHYPATQVGRYIYAD